jgi:hypothetical protein
MYIALTLKSRLQSTSGTFPALCSGIENFPQNTVIIKPVVCIRYILKDDLARLLIIFTLPMFMDANIRKRDTA